MMKTFDSKESGFTSRAQSSASMATVLSLALLSEPGYTSGLAEPEAGNQYVLLTYEYSSPETQAQGGVLRNLEYCQLCQEGHEAKAFRYCKRAAEAGNHDAEFELALMYLDGKGTEQDADIAMRWLARAYQAGHERAGQVMDFVINGDYLELGC